MSETSYTVREPGLNILPPGVERYVVAGGGINVLQIFPEDKIEIINDEGKQIFSKTYNEQLEYENLNQKKRKLIEMKVLKQSLIHI